MKHNYPKRMLRLLTGLFLCGLGVALNVSSRMGLAPWSVLNSGIALTYGITLGRAGQLFGLAVIVIDLLLKQPIGVGTVCNMYFIGFFTDFIAKLGVIPQVQSMPMRLLYLLTSMLVTIFGGYLYMSAGLGAGPRDSLMVGLTKRSKRLKVGAVRMMLETSATAIGWFMGALVGIGTLITAFGNGPLTQVMFGYFNYNVRSVKQESMIDTWRNLTGKHPAESSAAQESGQPAAQPSVRFEVPAEQEATEQQPVAQA